MFAPRLKSPVRHLVSPIFGIILGATYGVAMRLLFDRPPSGGVHDALSFAFAGMSLAFLFVVPFGLGALAAAFAPPDDPRAWAYYLVMPLLSAAVLMAAVLTLAWEGFICIVMAAPIYFAMAILGGVLVAILRGERRARVTRPAVMSALVLPLVVAPIEARFEPRHEERTIETVTLIRADPAVVWSQVVRVPRLQPEEQHSGFFQRIGIPRPLEATLSHEGVGGVREATFEGGVRFHERVTEWEPERALGFDIEADVASIGPDVLDRHVRVGGEYFDVLHGRFVIEPVGDGTVRLRLSSTHRLSTRLNGYAGLWTDAVMRDVQTHICSVIRRRCEAHVASSAR